MEKDIGKLQKNDTTDIVLRIDDFADKRGFTIREFVTSERYTGFTKSGVRILAKDWQKFKEMINSVKDEDMIDSNADSQAESDAAMQEAAMAAAQAEASSEEPSKEELPDY